MAGAHAGVGPRRPHEARGGDRSPRAVACALRLAAGAPRDVDAAYDWDAVLRVACEELLAPLAWARSGAFVRRHAPAPVTECWRRRAFASYARARAQLGELARATAVLEAADVRAIVLKGFPLGSRLYGDPTLRCTADIDLFVAAPERVRARAALESAGWQHADGEPPWHEALEHRRGTSVHHLELHSSLVCDHLAHLPVPPPDAVRVSIGDSSVLAHSGPLVPAYLAAHLATHQLAPLLWLVDFHTLWSALGASERAAAVSAAGAAGLGGYLHWAVERARLVARVLEREREVDALRLLGIERGGRRDLHSLWRHIALAPSPADAVRVAIAGAFPRPARGSVRSLARVTVRRLRLRGAMLLGAVRRYEDAQPFVVDRSDMLALVRAVLDAGDSVWVRAPGGSMLPTIPRGALVRLSPLGGRNVVPGTVVLALTQDGEPVLHRVTWTTDAAVGLRGDSMVADDPPVSRDGVLAVATHVRYGGQDHVIARQPRRSAVTTILKLRRRYAALMHRAG